MSEEKRIIGARIRDKRIELGMTQTELALKCGYTSKTTISKIEKGVNSMTTQTLQNIAEALGVDPMALLKGTEEESVEEFRNRVFSENRALFELVDKASADDRAKIEKIIKSLVEG